MGVETCDDVVAFDWLRCSLGGRKTFGEWKNHKNNHQQQEEQQKTTTTTTPFSPIIWNFGEGGIINTFFLLVFLVF